MSSVPINSIPKMRELHFSHFVFCAWHSLSGYCSCQVEMSCLAELTIFIQYENNEITNVAFNKFQQPNVLLFFLYIFDIEILNLFRRWLQSPLGIEPKTFWLSVRCSSDWAMFATFDQRVVIKVSCDSYFLLRYFKR